MTAMLFSRAATIFDQADDYIDPDTLEDLISNEELKLKHMQSAFIGDLTLCRLQFKLINALKNLLSLLTKPHSMQEFMQQLSKISSLFHEIDSELSNAKINKEAIRLEILSQEKRMQEIILAILTYCERVFARAARADFYSQQRKNKQAEFKEKAKEVLLAVPKWIQANLIQSAELKLRRLWLKNPHLTLLNEHNHVNKPRSPFRPKPKPGF